MKNAIRITRVRPTRKRKWKGQFAWSIFTVGGLIYRIVVYGEKVIKLLINFFDSSS